VSWINVKDKLPEQDQFCKVKYILPKGYHYNCAPEWMHRMFERDGVLEKKKNQIDKGTYHAYFYYCSNDYNPEAIIENKIILDNIIDYFWSGLRVDINKFVTHWKPSLKINRYLNSKRN
jgi:hypothetical protein